MKKESVGTILVTGATGTVGMEVSKALSRMGIPFRAAYHSEEKYSKVKMPHATPVYLDYGKKETIEKALSGVERLFLLTQASPVQLETIKAVVGVAKKSGVKRIVHLSAMGSGELDVSLARWHRDAEMYIEKSGVQYTIIRPNAFMQNFVNFYGGPLREEGKLYLPLGDAKMGYVDARDIAAVAVAALTGDGHVGKTYTLTGPEAITMKEAADVLTTVTGRKITYVNVPMDSMVNSMKGQGTPGWMVDAMVELTTEFANGRGAKVTQDIRSVTGKDATDFRKFAMDHRKAFA